MKLFRYYWLRLKSVCKRLARSSGSTHSIALGVAIGFFIGMAPIMGIQMVVAAAIAALCGASKLGAVLPVWITNPVSFIPVYGANYWLGHVITGWGPSMRDYMGVLEKARDAGEAAGSSGWWEGLKASVVEGSRALTEHGWDAFWAFLVGCTLSGLICAAIAYPVTYRAIDKLRRYRAAKRARAVTEP